jgi:acyl-CoA synthetase (AMP-forming)/AMP-acid ligase II/acyl carrier protein
MNVIRSTVIDRMLTNAAEFPGKTAFRVLHGKNKRDQISNSELCKHVQSLAGQFYNMGIHGNRVLLVYEDIIDFIITFFACQYAGVIPVPVPYVKGRKQFQRLTDIFDDARATFILCNRQSHPFLERGLRPYMRNTSGNFFFTDDEPGQLKETLDQPVCHETALIQYTSGSTANPKGVVITQGNIDANQHSIQTAFGCDVNSVICSWLPFHHDMGLIGNIIHAVYVGCSCILMSPFHFINRPQCWLEAISGYKVTHSGGPNFAYDLCVTKIDQNQLANLDLSCWKVAYNGSEPVRAETLSRFANHLKPAGFKQDSFFPCYGLAESTLLVSGNKIAGSPTVLYVERCPGREKMVTLHKHPGANRRELVSSGLISPGTEVQIINDAGRKCQELEEGEIYISGESVTSGYLNKNSNDSFETIGEKRFFKTGDLGFIYNDELFVNGRIKEMLIVRGRNIYPFDIEQAIALSHHHIEANGVTVFSSDQSDDHFIAVVEIKRNSLHDFDAVSIISSVECAIVEIAGTAPSDIVITTPMAIPRTTSGKLRRVECKDYYAQGKLKILASKLRLAETFVYQNQESKLPAATRNHDYATIREYVLDSIKSRVGAHFTIISDDISMSEMGIDSLQAVDLINTINKEFKINLNVTVLLAGNTLSHLIQEIENILWLKNHSSVDKEITI